MTTLGYPSVMDLAWLAAHMREDERAQWCAVTGRAEYDADLAARTFAMTVGPMFCLYGDDAMPLCAAGFEEIRPGVWQTWMAGTPEAWETHWRTITKHTRRICEGLFADGVARRIQTYALASRRAAHVWYSRCMGQTYEGLHRSFYADGQDAVCYARTKADWEAAHGQQQ